MHKLRLAIRYAIGFIGLRKTDVLLSSFPRSGSTWMRFLLCNLISLLEWDGKTVDFLLLNRTMVELGVSNLLEPWPHSSTIPRVVKTHRRYPPIFGRNRAIGIIRDPRDVMVSFYHFQRDRQGVYDGTFSEFIRKQRSGLQSWFRHYTSWRDHWDLIVKYENMREDVFHEFNQVLDILGIEYPEDLIRKAISRSSFESLQEIEDSNSISDRRNSRAVRDGRTQQWVDYFSEQDLAYYCDLAERFEVHVYIDAEN